MSDHELDELFNALRDANSSASSAARAALLQRACEVFWTTTVSEPEASRPHSDDFVALLQDDDNLRLVGLIIPDLRPHAPAPACPLQQDLRRRINPERSPLAYTFKTPAVSEEFEEERRRFQDAEILRASVLLGNKHNLDINQQEHVREWLDNNPIRSMNGYGQKVCQKLYPSVAVADNILALNKEAISCLLHSRVSFQWFRTWYWGYSRTTYQLP